MIQVGIDNWAIAKRGKRGEAGGWISQGDTAPGRKFPIVFAAIMLQDPEMMNIKKNAPETAFGEDEATVFGRTWTGADVCYTGTFHRPEGLAEVLMRTCIRAYGLAPVAPCLRHTGGSSFSCLRWGGPGRAPHEGRKGLGL